MPPHDATNNASARMSRCALPSNIIDAPDAADDVVAISPGWSISDSLFSPSRRYLPEARAGAITARGRENALARKPARQGTMTEALSLLIIEYGIMAPLIRCLSHAMMRRRGLRHYQMRLHFLPEVRGRDGFAMRPRRSYADASPRRRRRAPFKWLSLPGGYRSISSD